MTHILNAKLTIDIFDKLQEILPDLSLIDKFLKELLPGEKLEAMDLMEDVLKGNWVLNPEIFWEYIKGNVENEFAQLKTLFVSILLLFILSAVITSFLSAFHNEGAAKAAKFFFILCQLVVLIAAFKEVMEISTGAMNAILEFLKIMIPAYMMCVAAAGSGLTAMLFYKLLLGFLCMLEGIVISGLVPVIEGYVMLGVLESLFGEEHFLPLMDTMKKAVLWMLKALIVFISGSGMMQTIITPVIDKANVTFLQKSASAIPGIGDIAESISSVTIASAVAVKNSMGVVILLIIILIIIAPVIKIFCILGAVKLGSALGGISGEKHMVECSGYITDAGFLLLRMLVTITTLFFITIAVLTNVTGGGI